MTIAPERLLSASTSRTSLRVAVNFGNVALARKDAESGKLEGVSIELAKALSSHVNLPLDYVAYPSAGKVVDAAEHDEWDIAFLAFDLSRQDHLTFSPPYAFLEATFVVCDTDPYQSSAELDVPGVKLSVTRNAAYELYLRDRFQRAEMLHAATPAESLDRFVNEDLHAAAGIRQALDKFAATSPKFRVLFGLISLHQTVHRYAQTHPRCRIAGRRFYGRA